MRPESKAGGEVAVTVALFIATATGGLASSRPIPPDQPGTVATREVDGDRLSMVATQDGARLRCAHQGLEGEATPEGLWLISTTGGAGRERFRVIAVSMGRAEGKRAALPATGRVFLDGRRVRFIRPGLTEEYMVSADGVRQDFWVRHRPAGRGELRVELALSGAAAQETAYGANLRVGHTGRALAYSRLRVTDAAGRVLAARMEVGSTDRIVVHVDDAEAVYPVQIDPTFSDANWVGMGGVPGADSRVYAAAVDGSGNLYIGGRFSGVGPVSANGIAKWDGNTWSALGSGMDGEVRALAVAGSDLYAGGYFTTAGGTPAGYIARWNGNSWNALGPGMNYPVLALAASGSNLYAGGYFTMAGGVSANRIATWNGNSWSALDSGMNNSVFALAVSGSNLHAGGSFTMAGGVSAHRIATWNGNNWSALGLGMDNSVYALVASGGDLYAGGFFTTAGGLSANRIAKWGGSSWSALASGMSGQVNALIVSGSDLYAGGSFTTAGGVSANRIAKWNGTHWSALGTGMDDTVHGLAVSPSNLYAGGDFTTAGGTASDDIAWAVLGYPPGYNQLTGRLLPDGALEISFIGCPAVTYALDRAVDLAPPIAWVPQETNAISITGVLLFTNTPLPNTSNFWRIRSVP